ncbi:MAG: septation protein A [Gammaproteobacteria bacterium]|nr:septation protein A [Gammaproteobacteria bacterium]
MKFITDFFPILLFFIAYKMYDIYIATAVAIVAAVIQVAYAWHKHRHVENMQWITLGLIVVFGGLTLVLQDETFIKWKPSVVNWLFAIAFLGSQYIGGKTFIERMVSGNFDLPKAVWNRLNMSWVFFFVFSGFANLYVAQNYDTDTWVNFKLFGMLGLTFIFIIGQGIYMTRFMKSNALDNKEN